ncbi:MAG TPA: glycosyltransferase 87 family protein, partial [Sedimentisphaerales bacterium]
CFTAATGYFFFLVFVTHHIFWDTTFYAAVVKAMAVGVSPYDNAYIVKNIDVGYSNGFVYPPLVAQAFYRLRWLLLTPVGWTVLITAHLISWVSIPYLLGGSPKKWNSRSFIYVWGLYLVLFGLGGTRLLVVGNIAGVLFALLIFSIVVAIRYKDYKLFWAMIILCTFVKPYFLGFLLFPVILEKRYISAGLILCVLVALYALDYLLNPLLFSEYVAQITAQQSHLGNIGLSLFTLATAIMKVAFGPNSALILPLAIGIHFLFTAIIILVAYAIAERRVRPQRFDVFCCWVFMSAFLISPRIFDYDLAIVIVPFVLLARMLLVERGLGIGVAVTVAIFGLILRTPSTFQTDLSEWTATFAILGVWLGAATHWLTYQVADSERGWTPSSAKPVRSNSSL